MHARSWYLGSEALGCRTLRLESQSSAGLSVQPYPRSPDLVWPGHLHGTGCLSARAVGTGFPTVVRRLCLGAVCGWVWVLLTPPVLAGVLTGCVFGTVCCVVPLVSAVCGVRGWGLVSACFWDVCVFVRASLAPRRFRFRLAVWACVLGPGLGCAQPFLAGFSGVCFLRFFFCFVSLSRALWSLSPHPLSFGLGCWLFFFLWCVSACFGVLSPGGPLFLAWCCRFWLGGPPVPLWGSCLRCLLGGGFGRVRWCWRAVWWLWAVFVFGCRTLRLESQSSAGLSVQPYPRSPDLVWPGHLHGTGCLSARAVGTGFPTVVRRLCLGAVCGWVWVLLTPPVLAGVLGGCVWARFVVLSL